MISVDVTLHLKTQLHTFHTLYGANNSWLMQQLLEELKTVNSVTNDPFSSQHQTSVRTIVYLDIVGTVYHLVIYIQSNKIHKVIFNE